MASVSVVNNLSTALAQGFLALPNFYIGIGRGVPATWGVSQNGDFTFSANTLNLGATNLEASSIVVKSQDLVTTYALTTDYTVDVSTGIVTRVGAGTIPNDATVNVTFEVSFNVLLTETDLDDEIGRKAASSVSYVVADAGGTIITDGGTWSLSGTKTNHVVVQATFPVGEATGEDIMEFGVFIDVEKEVGVPGGQTYLEPADVADGGVMVLKQKAQAIDKDTVGELSRSFVLTL